jgi:DNA adenine methylase
MKTPITYWGGKQLLAALIIKNIPEHTTYVEPFLGGGAVFWAKPQSDVEIINDLNGEVVNFYRVLKTRFPELQQRIQSTPHSRQCYADALTIYHHPHLFKELDRAWAFYTATNQGRSGKIGSWGYGTIGNAVEKKIANRRDDFSEDYARRLDRVQIECADALKIVRLRDRAETFFYIDPPYYNSDMGHYGGYTEADFEALLQSCSSMQGKFLLSSYPSEILKKYATAHGWHTIEIEQVCTASPLRKKKVEVLTANYLINKP